MGEWVQKCAKQAQTKAKAGEQMRGKTGSRGGPMKQVSRTSPKPQLKLR